MVRTVGCCVLFLISLSLCAQTLALSPALPKLVVSRDGQTPSEGRSYELLLEASKRAHFPLIFQIQPWPRALAKASDNKNVLLYPVARTAERRDLFVWIGPVNKIEYKLFVLAKNAPKAVKSVRDLKGETIGVLRNDAANSYFSDTLNYRNLEQASEYGSLVQMFLNERFMYLAVVPSSFYQALEELKVNTSDVVPLFGINYTNDPFSYVVAKSGSDPVMVQSLKDAFDTMMKDGTWDKIYNKYE